MQKQLPLQDLQTLGAVTLSGAVTGGDQTISAAILKDYAETDVTAQLQVQHWLLI